MLFFIVIMSEEDVENCLNWFEKYRGTIKRYKCASVNFGKSSNFKNKTNGNIFETEDFVKNLRLVDTQKLSQFCGISFMA